MAKYNSKSVEEKRYKEWIQSGFFYSKPDKRKPYTLVIPPPNVTGRLHMGHMLNNTLQDVLARRARMRNYNVCWIPGTDHASIATENKVVNQLGISKEYLGRKAFLDRVWNWTNKHRNIIFDQLKRLGCSCDWRRSRFTLDERFSESVTKAFIALYKRGLIYRAYRMIHWDPEVKTTLSDEEILYEERSGKLYYIKYFIENTEEFIVVATTRPETIPGDSAICVNPNDQRYLHLKNRRAMIPIIGRLIPIIEDEYVKMSFGTGCLKVTPSHDFADQALAEKHGLEFIDATARRAIIKDLEKMGALVRMEEHFHKIGISERSRSIIEPRLSMQWFLQVKPLAKNALEAVGEIKFYPEELKNVYRYWMENLKDWNISRQLWWGHRIPVYYAEARCQDPDVLDTWFSSWLWPISIFDGIMNPKNSDILYYYPTQDLVTAPDILFFWVARMIMAGYAFLGEKPFNKVYFTGIVRDNQRKKMSKSLGNSPESVDLINQYGADGVRAGLLLSTKAGNDLLFDEILCRQGRNFSNKIWNAFRLIKQWEESLGYNHIYSSGTSMMAVDWFSHRFYQALEEIEKSFEDYKISEALMILYKLIREDFCSWYLELVKPDKGKNIPSVVFSKTVEFFENLLKLLHPFMPFLTEEIWQNIKIRSAKEYLMVSDWPKKKTYKTKILEYFENYAKIIKKIRFLRKYNKISQKEQLYMFILTKKPRYQWNLSIIKKLGGISQIEYVNKKPIYKTISFFLGTDEYHLKKNIDEKEKLEKDLHHYRNFLERIRKNISNKKFLLFAPKEIIERERKKEFDTVEKIRWIENQMKISSEEKQKLISLIALTSLSDP
jgi:valyl-tRNA synthetase